VIVTNVGVLGIEQGFAPLIPAGRTAALLTLGQVRDKVIAVEGRPEVRPVLTICGTFDHRVVDGAHLGKISSTLERVLEDPEAHFGRAELTARRDPGS
jgi:pyruvate dehydrogenase E2 component (dihydrolipoamide acetyltransferase)